MIISKELPHGIKIYIFNNLYYYFIFEDSAIFNFNTHAKNFDELKDESASVNLHYQKEMINAFNACLYISSCEERGNVSLSSSLKRRMLINGIDNYFIPNNIDQHLLPFSNYINCADFSTEIYRIACKSEYSKDPYFSVCIYFKIEEGLNMISKLLKGDCALTKGEYNKSWFNILSNIWKVIFFRSHDLRFEAVILLRSVYDTMVRKYTTDNKEPSKESHQNYCADSNLSTCFGEFIKIRNAAAHELKIIQSYKEIKNLDEYIVDVIKLFNRDTRLDISFINK